MTEVTNEMIFSLLIEMSKRMEKIEKSQAAVKKSLKDIAIDAEMAGSFAAMMMQMAMNDLDPDEDDEEGEEGEVPNNQMQNIMNILSFPKKTK